MTPFTHLQMHERNAIKKMQTQNFSMRQIAIFLDRHPSTISRELKRNKSPHWYRPHDAQELYRNRRKSSTKSKIELNPELKNHIIEKLENNHSPDAIAGRLKLTAQNDKSFQVSHETIYRWVYKNYKSGGEIYKLLPRTARKRQKRLNKYKNRLKIPNRVSIHDRPDAANMAREIGHWEADTIWGLLKTGYIATFVDRKSNFLVAGLMRDRKAETCNRATFEAFADVMNDRIKTITFDNGTEFFHHSIIAEALECDTYFADPYSAWQRGKNEKMNGMLRRYFPKKMDFSTLNQEDVDKAVWNLNNTPRRSLGFRTPWEVFYSESVALQL